MFGKKVIEEQVAEQQETATVQQPKGGGLGKALKIGGIALGALGAIGGMAYLRKKRESELEEQLDWYNSHTGSETETEDETPAE